MSLSDFLSSSRGPGLVGLVLAIVVLAGFVLLGTLTLDERFQGGGKSMEGMARENESEISLLKTQLQAMKEKLAEYAVRHQQTAQLTELNIKIEQAKGAHAMTMEKLAQANAEADNIEEQMQDYKARYREHIRAEAVGTTMDKLTTLNGTTYEQVKISSVSAIGVNILHNSGSCRISYEDLPAAMQEHYQFEAEEAEMLQRRENDQKIQHALSIEATKRSVERQQQQKLVERKTREGDERQRAIAQLASRISSLNSSINNMQNQIVQESYKGISRAPQMREKLETLKQSKTQLESKLNQLLTSP